MLVLTSLVVCLTLTEVLCAPHVLPENEGQLLVRVARHGHFEPAPPPPFPREAEFYHHSAPHKLHKKKFFIDSFEIDNTSAAKTQVLPVDIEVGVGAKADAGTHLANGILRGGPFPKGLLGHFDPKAGLLGTLGETLIGKDPLGLKLGEGAPGLSLDLDIPELNLGLGLGNNKERERNPDASVLESLLGDDPIGQLLGSLLKL